MANLYLRANNINNTEEDDPSLVHRICLNDNIGINAALSVVNAFNDAMRRTNPHHAYMWASYSSEDEDIANDDVDMFAGF